MVYGICQKRIGNAKRMCQKLNWSDLTGPSNSRIYRLTIKDTDNRPKYFHFKGAAQIFKRVCWYLNGFRFGSKLHFLYEIVYIQWFHFELQRYNFFKVFATPYCTMYGSAYFRPSTCKFPSCQGLYTHGGFPHCWVYAKKAVNQMRKSK